MHMTMCSVMPFCNPFWFKMVSRSHLLDIFGAAVDHLRSTFTRLNGNGLIRRFNLLHAPTRSPVVICETPKAVLLTITDATEDQNVLESWGLVSPWFLLVFISPYVHLLAANVFLRAMGTVELDVQTEAWHHPAPEWSCSDGHAHGALRLSGLETAGISWAWKNDVLVFGLQMLAFGVNSNESERNQCHPT